MEIDTHKTTGLNEALRVRTMDEPAAGGLNYDYRISPIVPANPGVACAIKFQNGSVNTEGVNGISEESLLAVLCHRLQARQDGLFANDRTQAALDLCSAALNALKTTSREEAMKSGAKDVGKGTAG